MRYLAIDLGDRRTGLAVGDSITGSTTPAGVLEVPLDRDGGNSLLAALERAIEEHLGPGELVIGVPLNMDGTVGPRAQMVRAFAARLADRTKRVVHEQDERLTSVSADWTMAQSGLTHAQKKKRRDALAAAAILRDFLASRGNTEPGANDSPGQDEQQRGRGGWSRP